MKSSWSIHCPFFWLMPSHTSAPFKHLFTSPYRQGTKTKPTCLWFVPWRKTMERRRHATFSTMSWQLYSHYLKSLAPHSHLHWWGIKLLAATVHLVLCLEYIRLLASKDASVFDAIITDKLFTVSNLLEWFSAEILIFGKKTPFFSDVFSSWQYSKQTAPGPIRACLSCNVQQNQKDPAKIHRQVLANLHKYQMRTSNIIKRLRTPPNKILLNDFKKIYGTGNIEIYI